MNEPTGGRIGRPPKVDAEGTPTRQRLLEAAAAACIEYGFEGATLGDIAKRADVSTPAIYNHFTGKSDLLVQACREKLLAMRPAEPGVPINPYMASRFYLDAANSDARILQLEVHLAATRHDDVRDLLAKWHTDNAKYWPVDDDLPAATTKSWYMLLLGLAQRDVFDAIVASDEELAAVTDRLIDSLFPNLAKNERR